MPRKHTKTAAVAPPKPADDLPTADLAAAIFAESLGAILREIRGIASGSIKPQGHDAASRIAWLAGRAASVAAEQRKAESGELRKLTPAIVLTWIREQAPEYRARLAREVTAMDAKERRSVLG